MKKLTLLTTSLALLALAGCKDEKPGAGIADDAVRFTSNIRGMATRATDTSWGNDAIGVYMVNAGGTLGTNPLADNKKYTTVGTGNFVPATPEHAIYFPLGGAAVDFVAYYPYTASVAGYKFPINVATQSPLSAIDLLYSNSAKGVTGGNPAMVFGHKLTKLVFNVSDTNGDQLTGMTAKIEGMSTRGEFDLSAGTLATTPSTVAPIQAVVSSAAGSTAVIEAIVLPAEGLDYTLRLDIPGGKYAEIQMTGITYLSGTRYVYPVNLNSSNSTAVINGNGTITDWNTVDGGTINIDKQDGQGGGTDPDPDPTPSVFFNENFGTATDIPTASRKKVGEYTDYAMTAPVVYSDQFNTADIRTTNAIAAHVWFAAKKDVELKISGINTSGKSNVSFSFEVAGNFYNSSDSQNLNSLSVTIDGVARTVESKVLSNANGDNNKFYTLTFDNVPAKENLTVVIGCTATSGNEFGWRIDNVKLTGGGSTGGTDPQPGTPTITSVAPTSLNFAAAGGSQNIAVTMTDQGSNTLSVSGLSGLLGATVSGSTVTVTASTNNATAAVNQTLHISLANGNSVDVPVTIAAAAGGGGETVTEFVFTGQTSETDATVLSKDGVTLTPGIGGGSLKPRFWIVSGTDPTIAIRLYLNNTFTVAKAGGTITKIEFALTSNYENLTNASTDGSYTSPIWTGSSASVLFNSEKLTANNQSRFTKVIVTHK